MNKSFKTVEEYIYSFPIETQEILIKIQNIIKELANDIEESISYGMPAYKLKKQPVIYFAAYQKHIGIYATPSAHNYFSSKLKDYKQGKGSVQFPLNHDIPYDLIREIIEFKLSEIK
jgi:uncharacterized protein YdhG (YjbR/CyaY superfamily)